MSSLRTLLSVASLAMLVVPAAAQVSYDPYGQSYPSYPVPGGVIQPDETLGTSPSFEVAPYAYGVASGVRIVERCQYPDGWNSTDFSRDVNGIPAGIDHTCISPRGWHGVRARY